MSDAAVSVQSSENIACAESLAACHDQQSVATITGPEYVSCIYFGVPADTLARQCRSVHFLQAWWRFRSRKQANRYTLFPESATTTCSSERANAASFVASNAMAVDERCEVRDDAIEQSIALAQMIGEMVNAPNRGRMRCYCFRKPLAHVPEPKRPPNSYFLFVQEETSKLEGRVPDGGWNEFAKSLTAKWKGTDQSAYNAHADRFMRKYEQ